MKGRTVSRDIGVVHVIPFRTGQGAPPGKRVVCNQAPHCKPAKSPALAIANSSDSVQVQALRVAAGIKAAPQCIH